MDEKEVVQRMQSALNQSKMAYTNKKPEDVKPVIEKPIIKKNSIEVWLDSLPEVSDNHFLLSVNHNNNLIVFCVQELSWTHAMNIDMKSYRLTEKDENYYSEEYERRNTLSRAIVWAADSLSQSIIHNTDSNIIERIDYEIIDLLWQDYKIATNVTAQEAQRLYESTRKYLCSEAQEGIPIPAIIPETIAIIDGWCSLSREELKNISASDWERMQIVRMARADLMGVYNQAQINSNTQSVINHEIKESDNKTFSPDSWRDNFPMNHPNRPPG